MTLLPRKENEKFVWGEVESLAFRILKQKLTSKPIFTIPDFTKNLECQLTLQLMD